MAKRGTFMGITGEYGGFTSHWSTIIGRTSAAYFRCGTPELNEMWSDPSHASNPGTFDTTLLEAEVAAVHAAGLGYVWSMLTIPKAWNASGPGKYYPTDSTKRTALAFTAAVCATVLMDEHRSTGLPVFLEFGQESNIHNFNLGDQNAATVAAAHKAVIDAVRAAEPDLPIIFGSIANRGDINNSGDADVIAHWDGPNWVADLLSAEPTLKTTSAPDYWGYHPYSADSNPQSLTVGWGMQQMYNFAATLAFAGAKSPNGGAPKVCVTEYGSRRERDLSGISGTANGSPSITSSSGFLDGDSANFGEEGADIAGTNIPASTTILTVDDSDTATMSQNATGTVSGVTITRDAWAAEQLARYIVAFDTFRNAGWVAGPEFVMGKTEPDSENLYMWDNSEVAYGNGAVWEFCTEIELGPDTPVDPPPTGGSDTDLDYKIEIGVPPFGTINTTTWQLGTGAARNQIDNGYGLASAYAWYEITDDVQEITIQRGSSRRDQCDVGTASIVVRNDRTDHGTAGDYSSFNWSSPLFPFLGPQSRIRVYCNGERIWGGQISNIRIDDITDNIVQTTFESVDGLALLNRTVRYTPEAVHTAGKRIGRIFERAKVYERGDQSYLFTGVNTYQAGTPQRGSALQMVADVAFSEGGMVYCNVDHVYIFIDRAHMTDAPALATYTDDPAGEIRYSAITRGTDYDYWYQTFGIRGLEDDAVTRWAHSDESLSEQAAEYTLPIATEIGQQYRANELLADFKNPRNMFTSITIPTSRYSKSVRIDHIFEEVGHVIEVSRQAPGEARVTANCVIVGINHRISQGGKHFETEFLLVDQL